MNENINRIFSNNLRKWLSIRHKTQADMYKKMGVSSASTADWCTGKKMPKVDKIVALADWLMIELSDLLEDGDRVPSDMDRLIYRLKDDRYFYELARDIQGFDGGKKSCVLEATDQRDRDNKRDKARTKGYFFIVLCPFISLWPETYINKVT